MIDADNLEQLSAREVHALAALRAVRHLDGQFLWDLLKELPASEALSGRADIAEADALHLSRLIADVIDSGEWEVAETMRPFYTDYLRSHGVSHGPAPA